MAERTSRSAPAADTPEQHEQALARTRGVSEGELATLVQNISWFVSNRTDDRVVLWERDPHHPGGEVFLGGSAPDRAFRTPMIQRLLASGEVIEVPEPQKTVIDDEGNEVPNPKMPIETGIEPGSSGGASPGQAVPLGRQLDPGLWGEGERKAVAERQQQIPGSLPPPAGATVPSQSEVNRPA